jgi:hypothetical protein
VKRAIFLILCIVTFLKTSGEDYTWWNKIHGWEPGMPGWRSYLHLSPGYMGPNALPVPEVKKGIVQVGNNVEFGMDFHFMKGDPTQDLFAKYYRSFAENKIAIELYWIVVEHYAMSTYIRDERFARDFDGKGLTIGDFYFSTLIQVIKGKKFPDTMFRMACRTASGNQLDAARYTDSPGYFFDFSFSKEYPCKNEKFTFLPFASVGFYSWQIYDEINVQDDAFMYGIGGEFKCSHWTFSNSLSGYSGYKKVGDKPLVYTIDLNRSYKNQTIRLQYLHGLRDWNYRTIKLSLIVNLKNN